jgi:hypothetical protein
MSDATGERTLATRHASMLDRYFELSRNGTEPRTELIAGVTTFLTMAYIVFVNPQILGTTGMDKGAVFVATCLAAAASSLGGSMPITRSRSRPAWGSTRSLPSPSW